LIAFFLAKLRDTLLILLGVATLVFTLFNILPGDPARMMLDQREDSEQLAAIRAKYGFDLPIMTRYQIYLNDLSPISRHKKNTLRFNPEKYNSKILLENEKAVWLLKWPYLGESFQRQGKGVSTIIGEVFFNTALLAITAMSFALLFGGFIGVLTALRKDSFFDRFWTVFGTFGMALPSFFSAVLMAWIFGFLLAEYTGLSMTGNLWELDDYGDSMHLKIRNLILPALTLGIRPLAVIIQLVRSSMLEVLEQDYIRTARAKGLPEKTVLSRHALRNALNPVITAVSGWFASMLAGAVFIEYIFGWNGMGKQLVDALHQLDMPLVMGLVLVIATLFVVIQLFVDFLYAWLDPRLR
jgi:peptide/nickel transport system permease protein